MGLLVATLLLTACISDEPEPTDPSSPGTSTTTSANTQTTEPSPTPTVPELPKEATVGDAAGAEAFVRHWIDLLNYAYATGDTQPAKATSEAGCEACSDSFSEIEARDSVDTAFEDGLVIPISVRSPPLDAQGLVSVSARIEQEEGVEVSADGTREIVTATPPTNLGFVVAFVEGQWAMAGIGSE